MKTLLIAVLLVCSVFAAYNTTKAKNLAYACASTFGTEAEINSWTCKYCSYYKLISVRTDLFRPKHSTTPFSISSATLATQLLMMQLWLHSGVLSVFRTGLLISMPPRSPTPDVLAARSTRVSIMLSLESRAISETKFKS